MSRRLSKILAGIYAACFVASALIDHIEGRRLVRETQEWIFEMEQAHAQRVAVRARRISFIVIACAPLFVAVVAGAIAALVAG